jgi:tetratricopeptide (TPR) repeat protein
MRSPSERRGIVDVNQETRSASQDELPQEIYDPLRTDPGRVEETTQKIREVVESASSQFWEANVRATSPKSRLIRTLTFVASTWVVFFAVITLFTLLMGWILYGTSPLHSLERIAHEQAQERREQVQVNAKKEMGAYYVDLGNSLLNVGQAKAARAEFEKALDVDPLNIEAQEGSLQSELFMSIEEDNFDPGITEQKLNELLDRYPKDTQLWAFLGDVFSYYAPDEALKNYKKAIRFNPRNAYAYSGMANLYYDQGKYDKNLEMAKKAYDIAPWDSSLQHNYANALYAQERYQDAIAEYEDLTQWDPEHMWAYHDLAQLYRLTGDLEHAQWSYEQFIGMLEDKEVATLEKNQGVMSFTTGPDSYPVYLDENSEMRYYAYYSIALTSYLRGYPEEAAGYVGKAEDIQIDPDMEWEINRLMGYDITLLEENQQDLKARAEGFRSLFLY